MRATLLLMVALTASACGARLTDEQRAAAVAGSVAVGQPAQGGDGPTQQRPAGSATQSGGDEAAIGDAGTQAPGTATEPQPDAAGGTPDSGGRDGSEPGAGDAGSETATVDTRSMPPGGNGGATDVGVTEDSIKIFQVADVSGASPGIFQDTQLAVQAYVAMFNATEGTVYGRRLDLEVRDSQLNASRNRSHYEDACRSAFAAVGSMSAFDEGVAGPVSECGLPDLRATAVNPATIRVPTVFSADAISDENFPTNDFIYYAETFPGIETRAASLYLNNETAHAQTQLMTGAARKVGYEWVMIEAIGLAETNYSSFVIELKNKEVEFVIFTGDVPQAVRLAQAMRQQNYWPTVYTLQQNLYSTKLLAQGGPDVEDVFLSTSVALREQIERHPELQRYREWLKRVAPDAEPTTQGTYAWGAGILFTDCLKAIGPALTRDALVECYENVHDFTGHELFPPQDIGGRVQSNCHVILQVQDGAFVPLDPPGGQGYACRGKAESP